MEQGDPFETFQPGKQTPFSEDPYISGVFQLDEPKKRFPFTFQQKFPEF